MTVPSLPRSWVFPTFPGGDLWSYERFPLDEQPRLPPLDDGLAWLEREPECDEWTIDGTDAGGQSCPLTPECLAAVAAGLKLPAGLRSFAARPHLQRRVRSATACYLDLGDRAVPTSDGGHLVHLLSDQQWVLHWLLHVDAAGAETVVVTRSPLGFEEAGQPAVVELDRASGLEVCADGFVEFLYRFWIENEIWFALDEGMALRPPLAGYVAELAAAPNPRAGAPGTTGR